MQVQIEREIQIRASRSSAVLTQAIQIFRSYLEPTSVPTAPEYYRARNFLKEGKAFYDQTIQDAKKLLGPIPIYAAKDFEGWRSQALIKNKIVVKGETLEELRAELTVDDFVKTMMSAEEVETYLKTYYDEQKSGKRKLANIKIRMILDKLASLVAEGQELQKTAQRKQQGLPI
ncbi:MAG: hypothetical protein NT006_06885 [Candidatus Aminicenantes bacterium]|nr:hypothetical protein [Candidatus Aminicenantes bacterium]